MGKVGPSHIPAWAGSPFSIIKMEDKCPILPVCFMNIQFAKYKCRQNFYPAVEKFREKLRNVLILYFVHTTSALCLCFSNLDIRHTSIGLVFNVSRLRYSP